MTDRIRTTAENMTDDQIKALRAEAATAGDLVQFTICEAALAGDEYARGECAIVIAMAQALDD